MEKLAIFGGKPTIENAPEEIFAWPIITKEDEEAYLDVLRNNSFSGTDITEKLQEEFAQWIGTDYAVAYCNGTLSLAAAMFGIGLKAGDEIICTTKTYWASILQAMSMGATPVFCNVDDNLSMDPDDIERCITKNTKALMVVHYISYPADMDRIMAIAKKYNLKVIEDVSHAQGGLYKGKRLGTFGDVAAMSLMSCKSFAAGELGMLVTSDKKICERAIAYAHYERNCAQYITESEDLKPYYNMPLGFVKGRANQSSSALARVQLKYYDERCVEVRKAMNYFWDLLEGVPGIRPIRVDESTGSNMAGWYCAHGTYYPEELGGLSVKKFCEAVRAEGYGGCWDGANYCLHNHEIFKSFDFLGLGKPTRKVFNDRDASADDDKCNPSNEKWCFLVPRFVKFDKEWIEKYASAFRKVAENYQQLLAEDTDNAQGGRWYGMSND